MDCISLALACVCVCALISILRCNDIEIIMTAKESHHPHDFFFGVYVGVFNRAITNNDRSRGPANIGIMTTGTATKGASK